MDRIRSFPAPARPRPSLLAPIGCRGAIAGDFARVLGACPRALRNDRVPLPAQSRGCWRRLQGHAPESSVDPGARYAIARR